MRVIKFRAWDKDLNKMCKVNQIDFLHYAIHIEFVPDKDDEDQEGNMAVTRYENVELMQFTGLKDKNKKEIYEGDIVKDEKGNIMICKFIQGSFGLSQYESRFFQALSDAWIENSKLEVIGNIYENPELLKKKSSQSRRKK